MSCESRRPPPAEVPPPSPRPRPLRLAVPGPPATREVERTSARPGLVPRTLLCRITQHCMHRRLELVPSVLPLRLLRRSANSWTAGQPAFPSRGSSVGGDPAPPRGPGQLPAPRARTRVSALLSSPPRRVPYCRADPTLSRPSVARLSSAPPEPSRPAAPQPSPPGGPPPLCALSPSAQTPA